MKNLLYLFRFIYRIRYWLLILPLIVALVVFVFTKNQDLSYEVETAIYTGVISGQNAIVDDPEALVSSVQNAKIENMITIMTSAKTLQKVSIRLFAQSMMYGDPQKDNTYINAVNYRELLEKTPKEVQTLIDKKSEKTTITKLTEYQRKDTQNFLYGLFNWNDPHFSYDALSSITVKRVGMSDILKITYSTDDPGLAYNTVKILSDIFVQEYDSVRFAGANDVIRFFEDELKKVSTQLNNSEDSLTIYNVKNKIINYGEQTKQVAAMNRDFTLEYEDNLRNYYSAKSLVESLEKRIGDNAKLLKSNNEFLNKLNNISNLTARITELEAGEDSVQMSKKASKLIKKLDDAKRDFMNFSESFYSEKYSKEGYPNDDIIKQWLTELLNLQKYTAQKNVLEEWKKQLDSQYTYYSPIGATLKRKEREINFTEASYLATLKGLHDATMKQKSMEMTSSTLKVVTPATYPLSPVPTKRKMVIMAAYLASLFFIIGFFIIIEFLDQTLRDRLRTERLTGTKVIGAFPEPPSLKYRGYEDLRKRVATKQLANAISYYFTDQVPKVINLLSIEPKEGKTFIGKSLLNFWEEQGLKIRYVNWETDFKENSREFILSNNFKDFIQYNNEDIIIIEYSALLEQTIPKTLLQESVINILVTNSNRTWKGIDHDIFEKLKEMVGKTPLKIELNRTKSSVTEEFTGLLPPYPKLRKLGYKIMNMGLTSKSEDIIK